MATGIDGKSKQNPRFLYSPILLKKWTYRTISYGWASNPYTCRWLWLNITSELYAPIKRAERDSDAKTAKRDVFPGVNRKNASASFSVRCMTMHETEWRSVWTHLQHITSVFRCFLTADNLHARRLLVWYLFTGNLQAQSKSRQIGVVTKLPTSKLKSWARFWQFWTFAWTYQHQVARNVLMLFLTWILHDVEMSPMQYRIDNYGQTLTRCPDTTSCKSVDYRLWWRNFLWFQPGTPNLRKSWTVFSWH